MIVQSVAISLDSIRVFLNIASICLDVFLILANLSILFVLLTLDGCKTASHCLIQLAICSFTFRSFLLVSFIAGSCFIVNGLRVGCNVVLVGGNVLLIACSKCLNHFHVVSIILQAGSRFRHVLQIRRCQVLLDLGNVSLVGCNSSIVFCIFFGTGSSFSTNSIFIVNYIALYLMNGVSNGFNVLCVGRDAVFMVGNFIAISLDSIRVFLNIASICLDVFLILANLSILFVLLTLDGCKTASHCLIQLAICSFTFRSFLIDVLLQSCIGILTGTNFLRDIFSIGCNIIFITSNASFMIVQSVAISLDSIRVFLNIASICLDVFLILANLSILFVLLTLDGCKTASHCLIQLAICSFTFRSFLLVSFIAGSCFIVNGLRVGCNGSVVCCIFVATGFSFISYGLGAVLYFFINCICVGCNVSLVGCNLLELFRSGADVINLFR